ncbi:MAG: fasciclin domain-containing protein [Rhodospirillaceae bacterium]|nr:MAG: fasciclin domain-containing protein [Rhodospirillaceae bacterium]
MKKLFASVAIAFAALSFAAAPVAIAEEAKPNIYQTAQAAGSFNILLAAVDAAGFDAILQGEGPLTVFAPVDEVFANLPEGTVEALLAEEGMVTLKAILGYHVVPGKLMAADLVGQTMDLQTAAGIPLSVDGTGDAVILGGAAPVVSADIETSNGVIHVIAGILLPGQ